MERLISFIIGYACGLFNTAYVVGRLHHMDIRNYGSGNAGTTNAIRVLGKKAGAMVYLGDFLKTVLAAVLARVLFREQTDCVFLYMMYAGFGVILGHNFPFYLHFKGGKGVAATSGLVIATLDLRLIGIGALFFFGTLFTTKYVSLSSLLGIGSVFAAILILGQTGNLTRGISPEHLWELYLLMFLITLLAVFQHRENIRRLFAGTERKIGEKKEK